jgi:hypothetical protein
VRRVCANIVTVEKQQELHTRIVIVIVCVCVSLDIQHAIRMRHIVTCKVTIIFHIIA